LRIIAIATVAGIFLCGIVNPPWLPAQSSDNANSIEKTAAPVAQNSPTFDAASIKKNNSGDGHIDGSVGGNRFRLNNVTPRYLIKYAYGLLDYQLSDAPNWIDTKHYDVDAKVSDTEFASWLRLPPKQQRANLLLALQALLADRFKLQISRRTEELPVYVLVVAKNGPKLVKATDPPSPLPLCPHPCFTANNVNMDDLARSVGQLLRDRVVLNETGLSGNYQVVLHWEPLGQDPSAPADTLGLSIFTALEEQLGLRIEAMRGPVDIIIIHHIEEPIPN